MGQRSTASTERFFQCCEGDIGLPSIVAHELYYGAYKSRKVEHNLETLRSVFTDLSGVAFDREDARASGEIRAALAAGTPIGPDDILMAGQAKTRDLTLVTNKGGESHRVARLGLEDWGG